MKVQVVRIILNLLPGKTVGPHLVILRDKVGEIRVFGKKGDWWSLEAALLRRPPRKVRRACDKAMRTRVDRAPFEIEGLKAVVAIWLKENSDGDE